MMGGTSELFEFLSYLYWPSLIAILIVTIFIDAYLIANNTIKSNGILLSKRTINTLDKVILICLGFIFFCISALVADAFSFKIIVSEIGFSASLVLILVINSKFLRYNDTRRPQRGKQQNIAPRKKSKRQLIVFSVIFILCWGLLISLLYYSDSLAILSLDIRYIGLAALWFIFVISMSLAYRSSDSKVHHKTIAKKAKAHGVHSSKNSSQRHMFPLPVQGLKQGASQHYPNLNKFSHNRNNSNYHHRIPSERSLAPAGIPNAKRHNRNSRNIASVIKPVWPRILTSGKRKKRNQEQDQISGL